MSAVLVSTVDIDAPAPEVWSALTDFVRYGEWSNFSQAEGEARVGSRLVMRMPGMRFRPTITVADTDERLCWVGTLGSRRLFHGEHSFTLSTNADGTTRVTNREEFSGLLTTLASPLLKVSGDNGYMAFNRGLKRHVEASIAPSAR
jgi:hypothetical protein